jgi:hypothetical protein
MSPDIPAACGIPHLGGGQQTGAGQDHFGAGAVGHGENHLGNPAAVLDGHGHLQVGAGEQRDHRRLQRHLHAPGVHDGRQLVAQAHMAGIAQGHGIDPETVGPGAGLLQNQGIAWPDGRLGIPIHQILIEAVGYAPIQEFALQDSAAIPQQGAGDGRAGGQGHVSHEFQALAVIAHAHGAHRADLDILFDVQKDGIDAHAHRRVAQLAGARIVSAAFILGVRGLPHHLALPADRQRGHQRSQPLPPDSENACPHALSLVCDETSATRFPGGWQGGMQTPCRLEDVDEFLSDPPIRAEIQRLKR